MKVGDLVRKQNREGEHMIGVVIDHCVDPSAPSEWFRIHWGSYGTFWDTRWNFEKLETINESR